MPTADPMDPSAVPATMPGAMGWHHPLDDGKLLSGAFLPIDAMPDGLRTVARAMPLTYPGDALRQVMVDGTPFSPLWVCFAVLIAWFAVCFGIAARSFTPAA